MGQKDKGRLLAVIRQAVGMPIQAIRGIFYVIINAREGGLFVYAHSYFIRQFCR